ncbi:hypothetical protein BGW36DRAFT_421383 [Talaromyces proteolyticus]|uniref:Rhodopsin domain-containing protein n=1 Tax=Talaromyces proteolyticus TaxID=1131652 RepID=A0AAD4Q5Q0_9EURO|nr:uncharacterized protein BGW36DRAFT_421383 [Talaromyces proteolyticus]KAH8704788.1 hypothetical protein BGW36DRAFT_421383 [Talaromyces proteolyticus]
MPAQSPFIAEAWIEFSIGTLAVFLRLFSRWKLVGFKGWRGDDYMIILAALFWTSEIVPVYLVGAIYGNNTGWTPEQRAGFSSTDISNMETGSKLVISAWFGYATIMWSLKASMLFYYDRMTAGIYQQKIVRACAVFCAVSYFVVILTIALHCRPFSKNWQVNPDPGRECSTHYTPYPVLAAFNVTTDLILVYVPIPMLIRVRLPITKKLMVGSLLCSGVFVMVASLLRCILSMTHLDQINFAAIWAFVAMVAVNAPAIKPLFSASTWVTSSKLRSSSRHSYRLSSMNTQVKRNLPSQRDKQDSQEFILSHEEGLTSYGFKSDVSKGEQVEGVTDGIKVTTEYTVTTGEGV